MAGICMVAVSLIIILSRVHYSAAVKCLECSNIPHGRDCDFARECGPHQICFHDMYVTTSGHIIRDLGCRSRTTCQASGRRRELSDEHRRASGDILTCSDCCDTNLCQVGHCGEQPYPTTRGPICFHCDQQYKEYCNNIILCDEDDLCSVSIGHPADGADQDILTSGCFPKMACDTYHINFAANVGKRSGSQGPPHKCFKCCKDDLCNHSCDSAGTGTTTTTTTSTTTTTTQKPLLTRAPCKDTASAGTCTMPAVQQIVCGDQTKAANAGCMHTCKFC